ncbi:TNF receptor-associated factor 4-like isoform X2 [Montipora foliosa]|uniref:TNF receptor-associated factor 4-like isoform X2 n=1 Tax=Montipora foliosa TaxID=591990 RepID=UPI0035F1154B
MTEGQGSPLPSGYDDKFVDAVEDDFHCPICHVPLKEAVQTGVCGHRFCRQCLERHFMRQEREGQEPKCPLDNIVLNRDKDIFPDKATQRKILSFIIHCPRDGCQWTGELRAKENHENDCQRFPADCPNGCGESIPRDEIFVHTQDKCPLATRPCPYADMGCTKKVQQDDMDSHIESEMRVHLDLVGVKLRDTEEELQKLRNKEEESQKLRNTQEELQKLRNKEQLQTLRNTQEELHNTKQLVKKLEERINAVEKKPFVYLWKIRGFHELLQQVKTGYEDEVKLSAPFYTSEFGYKVRMSLYPNGTGEGKNTHLSIFIYIMKGDYDSNLQWPFPKRVTFTLIDPKENSEDRDNISATLEKEGKTDWNSRPRKKENSVGMGFRKFVSHKLMKGAYILNDTIFIEARIV